MTYSHRILRFRCNRQNRQGRHQEQSPVDPDRADKTLQDHFPAPEDLSGGNGYDTRRVVFMARKPV
jgi:hypothetical protein